MTTIAPPLPVTTTAVMAVGPVLVVCAIAASVLGGVPAWSPTVPSWALAVALVALVLGIPHGAVDHQALARSSGTKASWVGRIGYLLVAAVAIAAILRAPGPAFVVVLAMSVWHFGTGDVEAGADLTDRATNGTIVRTLQVLALGCAPVVLPLTGQSAVSTLRLINTGLAEVLTPDIGRAVRVVVLLLTIVTVVLLLVVGDRRGAGELALLAVLGLVATPLVAFSVYFAAWHALRHTARLAAGPHGDVGAADLARTFAAGVPALVVTVAVAAWCVLAFHASTSLGTWMWAGLSIVWGLTVPHMIVVARFDRARSARRRTPGSTAADLVSAPTLFGTVRQG